MISKNKNKHQKKYFHVQINKTKKLAKGYFYIENLILYLMIFKISSTFSLSRRRNINVFESEIKLLITGNNANNNLLSSTFEANPSQVLVNGVVETSCSKTCYLKKGVNNVTIKFEEQLESCKNLFNGLTNIKEIDLSKFDASKVKDMSYMFAGCSNLEKIYFGNIKTNLVENMESLFKNCTKLTSIDLSNFETVSVTNMANMFSDCQNVKHINISVQFKTSKVEIFYEMVISLL